MLLGNYQSLSEIVSGTLQTDFNFGQVATQLATGVEKNVEFFPLDWATPANTLWKVSIDNAAASSECVTDLFVYPFF